MSHLSSYILPVRRDQSQPRSMHLYPVVHQLNQQVRDGMRQDLMKLREDTTKTRDGFKTLDTAPKVITSQYSTYERNAHFPQTGSRKRSRLPNVEVEHEEPQDGMSFTKRRKDLSKVICFQCHNPGHYADNCPKHVNVAGKDKNDDGNSNRGSSVKKPKKDSSQVTCYKYGETVHYSSNFPRKRKNDCGKGNAKGKNPNPSIKLRRIMLVWMNLTNQQSTPTHQKNLTNTIF